MHHVQPFRIIARRSRHAKHRGTRHALEHKATPANASHMNDTTGTAVPSLWQGRQQGYPGETVGRGSIAKNRTANRSTTLNRNCQIDVLPLGSPLGKRLLETQANYGGVRKAERICDNVNTTHIHEVLVSEPQTSHLIVAYDFSRHWAPASRWCGFAVVAHDHEEKKSTLKLLCEKGQGWDQSLLAEAESRSESVFDQPHPLFVSKEYTYIANRESSEKFYSDLGYRPLPQQFSFPNYLGVEAMAKELSQGDCQISEVKLGDREAMIQNLKGSQWGEISEGAMTKAEWQCHCRLQESYVMSCLENASSELIVAYGPASDQWCGFAVVRHTTDSNLDVLCAGVKGWGSKLLAQVEAQSKKKIPESHDILLESDLVEYYRAQGYQRKHPDRGPNNGKFEMFKRVQ